MSFDQGGCSYRTVLTWGNEIGQDSLYGDAAGGSRDSSTPARQKEKTSI